MSSNSLIVDTNILLLNSTQTLYVCETVLVELFKHKERIVTLSSLPETDVIKVYHTLIRHLNLYKETLIEPTCWKNAYTLCRTIDESDTPQVALTLHLNGLLWTGDKKLITGLRVQGFSQFFIPQT